jgi:hypothetical protein
MSAWFGEGEGSMAAVIRASTFATKRYLKVTDWGVDFLETALVGGRKKFSFGQIDYILISADNILSFQVGQQVFSIQTKPGKAAHQAAINHLVNAVAGSHQRVGGFPVIQP